MRTVRRTTAAPSAATGSAGSPPPLTFGAGSHPPAGCFFLVTSGAGQWSAPAGDTPTCPA
ncbi:MAG: hypothetical protein QOE93_1170 [Actinomycetota bacterium]|nr:hypothetical protein [Actinomycetota bacterium]